MLLYRGEAFASNRHLTLTSEEWETISPEKYKYGIQGRSRWSFAEGWTDVFAAKIKTSCRLSFGQHSISFSRDPQVRPILF